MKYIFLAIAVILTILSVIRAMTLPDQSSAVPVIYWTTDSNPARIVQIELFHKWLIKNGYVTNKGTPIVELRLDTANNTAQKVIVQGVSGVGSDIWDMFSGPVVRLYYSIGLLEDVTEAGKELNFSTDFTFPALSSELRINDRQYAFPCNVNASMYWVNGEAFEKVGMDIPPETWEIQTFESIGKEFVKRANPQGERQTVFFAPDLNRFTLARSMGVSTYNETLSDVNYQDPRFMAAYKLMYKWTVEDHLFPTAAERESFSSASGYGGVNMQLFNAGRFALLESGRYALIQLREFNKTRRQKGEPLLKLSVSRIPYEHFPVAQAATRCAGNYIGSPNKHLSKLFLAYLASEDYNMQIVADADSLPPNPKYTKIREFTHPADYPEEWGVHEPFAKTMLEIAIPMDHGPFIIPATVNRLESTCYDSIMHNLSTVEEATAVAVKEVRDEIARTLREDPKLVPLYEEAKATQKKIEEYRAQGKPVPLSWIKNPFYRKYYQFKGWAAVNE